MPEWLARLMRALAHASQPLEMAVADERFLGASELVKWVRRILSMPAWQPQWKKIFIACGASGNQPTRHVCRRYTLATALARAAVKPAILGGATLAAVGLLTT